MATPPLIIGIGGTTRSASTSERLLHQALAAVRARGCDTIAFCGEKLILPLYGTAAPDARAHALVEAARHADGIIIASPGYHGSVSGLVKNALDYVEELREDERPYLDGRAVGCIAAAAGWQAAGSTLGHLRGIVHALRGWPTPLGVIVNSAQPPVESAQGHIEAMAGQIADFVQRWPSRANAATQDDRRCA